jgi:hypothetical protein
MDQAHETAKHKTRTLSAGSDDADSASIQGRQDAPDRTPEGRPPGCVYPPEPAADSIRGDTNVPIRNTTSHQSARRVVLPWSEACVHMRVAGREMWVRPVANGMAQILNDDGSNFSSPITRGEAGLV